MKITFLGTAAVGFPLAFCNCDNCVAAKKHGGKSLRKKSSLLINDEMLIDLSPDVQNAMMIYQKDMGKVKYWLQTHCHIDHFYEGQIISRLSYKTDKKQKLLKLVAHPKCIKEMAIRISKSENVDLATKEGQKRLFINCNEVYVNDEIKLDKYTIKAIHTTHDEESGSLLYVITYNDKSIFYATDTPPLTDMALNELSKYKLDVVIMDHNFGNVNYNYSHLNETLFIEQINKLKNLNIINENTLIFGTHISHEGHSYHEEINERARSHGYEIAYDGLEINI